MHDDNQDQTDQASPLSDADRPTLARRVLRATRRGIPIIAFVALGAGLSLVTKRRT